MNNIVKPNDYISITSLISIYVTGNYSNYRGKQYTAKLNLLITTDWYLKIV